MRKLSILFAFFCAAFLRAQSAQTPPPGFGADPISASSRQFEILSREAVDDTAARRAAAERAADFERMRFLNKANRFVALWSDFANRLNGNRTFDVKLAKKLSKAFHELETSEGWPVREEGK